MTFAFIGESIKFNQGISEEIISDEIIRFEERVIGADSSSQ